MFISWCPIILDTVSFMTFSHPVSFLTGLCYTLHIDLQTKHCHMKSIYHSFGIETGFCLVYFHFLKQINSAKLMHYKLGVQLVSVFKLVNMGIQLDGQMLDRKNLLKLLNLYSKSPLKYECFKNKIVIKTTATFHISYYILGLRRHFLFRLDIS